MKAGGADALTEAERRADAARYQEVRCRSALNAVKGMPFDWTLNPYRGCTHGCHYCYARRYQTQFELELADAGIRVGVLMNPIVPGITSKPALLERTMKAIADHGARFVSCNVMFLEGGTREHFMRWLQQEFPHLVDGYGPLYAGKYAPKSYRAHVRTIVTALRTRYGVKEREDDAGRLHRDRVRTGRRDQARTDGFDDDPVVLEGGAEGVGFLPLLA